MGRHVQPDLLQQREAHPHPFCPLAGTSNRKLLVATKFIPLPYTLLQSSCRCALPESVGLCGRHVPGLLVRCFMSCWGAPFGWLGDMTPSRMVSIVGKSLWVVNGGWEGGSTPPPTTTPSHNSRGADSLRYLPASPMSTKEATYMGRGIPLLKCPTPPSRG